MDNLKEKYESIKNGMMGFTTLDKAKAYRQGIMIGGIGGFVIAFFAHAKKKWLWAGVGALIGGYLAHQLKEQDEAVPDFGYYGEANDEDGD